MKIVQDKWLDFFLDELTGTKELKIISPFITDNMVSHLLKNWRGEKIQIITRFNLNDFRSRVSSLRGLSRLVDNGAEIKGIKDLHSKAYIFDSKSMIITSANFTNGGFFNNYELGIKTESIEEIKETINYFNKLWLFDSNFLKKQKINEWQKTIEENKTFQISNTLNDYGTSIVNKVIGNTKHFVKFYGTGDDRADWNWEIEELVKDTHCHFAITFSSENGRPVRYNEGDIVYMARMMNDGEYAIFGKAIARKHNRERDVASDRDIDFISWKKYYNIYIRVHSAQFLKTTFFNCPRMGIMMNELGYESFKSTLERHKRGEENINPRLSLKQKPDVLLSSEGAFWVEQKFQEAVKRYGLISNSFIDGLYQGDAKI